MHTAAACLGQAEYDTIYMSERRQLELEINDNVTAWSCEMIMFSGHRGGKQEICTATQQETNKLPPSSATNGVVLG